MRNQPTSTCSAGSEALLLPLDGLDLKPLDSATTNPMHKPSSKSIGRMSQSTETSKHSMARHTEESLFSQEDFPASRSVVPGSGEARMTTAISGRKCSESYKRQDQLGFLVRMLLESSVWHSTKCVLTWKRVDMKSSRLLFRLAPLMPSTEGNEFGFWPTPTGTERSGINPNTGKGEGLSKTVKMWPTPASRDKAGISGSGRQQRKGYPGDTLPNAVYKSLGMMWPTPRANKVHPTITEENREKLATRNKANLEEVVAGRCGNSVGQLNPDWVEWLMGYPIGHTVLKDWATPSSRKSPSKSLKELKG